MTDRDVLLRLLTRNREAVVRSTEGLSEEQVRASGVPSGTSLLGIVQHLGAVEDHWFTFVFAGVGDEPDHTMVVPAQLTRDDVVAGYLAACARSDAVILGCDDLSTLAARPNPGEEEWGCEPMLPILVHMVEETARHAGHCDILREQIDGRVDDDD